ncbi:hypothetical protein Tco_0906053 [Tanacetum coccineum]
MKHWKSGFFFINRRAILDAMVWRHPNTTIDDPRTAGGSFYMADVRLMAEVAIPGPTPKDLAVGTPSFKIVAKPEASQKSTLAQSSGSTTRPSLFVGDDDESDDDDDDACVEIPLVTYLRSAVGVMVDDAAAPSSGVSRPRPSSGPAPSFTDVSSDAIHTDFFPFSAGPCYATYPEGGVVGNYKFTRKEWDAPYRPTFGVLTKEVFKDLVVCKTVVDQFPTPGEMVRVESLSENN